MDLNEIKTRAQRVKAPQAGLGTQFPGSESLEELTARLRVVDKRERRGLRKAALLYAIAAALLLLVSVATILLPPTLPAPSDLVFRVVLFSNFLLIAVVAVRTSRQLAEVDYAAPMREFLEATERRYRFLRPRDYLTVVVGCLLVGAVTGIHVVNALPDRYFFPRHLTWIIAGFCVVFAGLCVMGLVFTHKIWKRDKRALWLGIRQTLAELDTAETDSTPSSSDGEASSS